MPAISIIIPVYQAEALLRPCLESVLAQTFTDWELLLIDDGSRDASGAICDEYAERDSRVRVFHKPNGGVSSARNLGLREAAGGCVAFLDADDAFVPRTLETLWDLRQQTGADTVGCAHWNVTDGGAAAPELLLPAGVYEADAIRQALVRPLFGERLVPPIFNGFLWRYLFDGELLRQDPPLTMEGAYLEDELFLVEYFCRARRLAVTEEPLYRYYFNPNSATHRYMADYAQVFARFLERKTELARQLGLDALCPTWRESTVWASILIAVGNEYAPGNTKSIKERQRAVEALCREPEAARAMRALHPTGMGRNKQVVADLLRGGHFTLLTLLYRLKNRM